jgi:hypothetical protein
MKKVIKLKESDLQRIVKRVLSEQLNTTVGTNISTTPPGGLQNEPMTQLNPQDAPDGYIVIGYGGEKRSVNFDDSDLIVMGGLVGGVLSLIAGTLIKKGITKMIRKRDLKFISKEIGKVLEKELSKEDIKCLKNQLLKVGKITKLNDEKTYTKVKSNIGYCLANSKSNITVDEFYTQLEDVVNKWDNSKTYRKGLRKRDNKK